MSKKIVIQADLVGQSCMSEILSVVATIEGIKSMDIDPEKCTLTVVGPVDPVRIVQKLKKKCHPAKIISVADDKPPEKKDPCKEACEKLCKEKCDKLTCCKECKDKCEKECKEQCETACNTWLNKGCPCGGAGSCCRPPPPAPGCYYTAGPCYCGGACRGGCGMPVRYGAICYEEPGGQCTIQ
ncbi:hypothetical protein ACP4OV_008846 [Aristida adscensionis]